MFKKIQYNSPVILTFTLISLFALILGYLTQGVSTTLLFAVYRSSPKDPLTYVRLFTHVLGHASFDHYFNNIINILLIGPLLEEKYGSKNMLIMIITTALVTGILNVILFDTGLLGASGVVFMLILLSSFVNLSKGKIPFTLILVVIIFLGREIYSGIIFSDNISRITHVAGGICGAIMGYVLNYRKFKEHEM